MMKTFISSDNNKSRNPVLLTTYLTLFVFITAGVLSIAQAGPAGENVVRGDASFERSGDKTVIRASDGSIIEYSRFNIGPKEAVRFIQPSSSARSLNRVIGGNATDIYGQLIANGIVYLTNPAGIYFHNNSVVDVGGIYAAAGNIANEDFINGLDRFTNLTGDVKNWGTIDAELTHLIGRSVSNFGTINAPDGTVTMLSGEDVLVGEMDGHIYAKFSGAARTNDGENAAVENKGTIEADGGQVMLGAGDMVGLAVHNNGNIESNNVQMTAEGGDVINADTVDTSGETGGDITMSADRVAQLGTMHADGTSLGGGDIDINADNVVVLGPESLTTANAGESGDGGEVIVFSPKAALFRTGARIEARGGSTGGNGGFAEVSGHKHIEIQGLVNTMAPAGENGTFLIDPYNIAISNDAENNIFKNNDIWSETGSGANVNVTVLETQLASSDVSVATQNPDGNEDGDITVQDAISWDANTELALGAEGSVRVNDNIDSSGGTLSLMAKNSIKVNAPVGGTDAPAEVTMQADDIAVNNDLTSDGDINVFTADGSAPMNLGGSTTGGGLSLSDAELNRLDPAGTLTFGKNSEQSGNIYVGEYTAPIEWENNDVVYKEKQNLRTDDQGKMHIEIGEGVVQEAGYRYFNLKEGTYCAEVLTPLDYTNSMLMLSLLGVLGLFFAFLLKRDDKTSGYGLEKPNKTE